MGGRFIEVFEGNGDYAHGFEIIHVFMWPICILFVNGVKNILVFTIY